MPPHPSTDPTAHRQFRRPATRRRSAPDAAETDGGSSSPVLDTRFLESLIGYNARRAALAVIEVFLERMSAYELRVVDFSVMTLIAHNPGVTSRQVCAALAILPPNLVGIIRQLEQREWVEKRQHPSDRRAQGLYLTPQGQALQAETQEVVQGLESEAVTHLSLEERDTLIRLLRKVYQGN